MPLIQISLIKGKPKKYVKAVADGIHNALCSAWGIPEDDRFQLITEYEKRNFIINKKIWNVNRSDDVIVIYITSIMRPPEMKNKLYHELVKVLGKKPGVRKEDIFVTMVQNDRENWSFGNGIAQLM